MLCVAEAPLPWYIQSPELSQHLMLYIHSWLSSWLNSFWRFIRMAKHKSVRIYTVNDSYPTCHFNIFMLYLSNVFTELRCPPPSNFLRPATTGSPFVIFCIFVFVILKRPQGYFLTLTSMLIIKQRGVCKTYGGKSRCKIKPKIIQVCFCLIMWWTLPYIIMAPSYFRGWIIGFFCTSTLVLAR